MTHIFSGDFSKLESDTRKKLLPVKKILEIIAPKKGSTLIDFGCGIGYFSIPALDFVGIKGKVIAIDISDKMLDELKKRTIGISNIELVKSDKIKMKADIILIVTVLHEVNNPKEFFISCFSHLNQGGKLVIIDWEKNDTEIGPPKKHRIAKEEVLSWTNHKYIEHKLHSLYFLEFFN